MHCPVCKADNSQGPQCRRCKADLSLLFALEEQRRRTLAEALCAHLPGHVTADEPYYLLEEEGYEFGFPPSLEDYRALLAHSVRSLTAPLLPGVIFDRTPLDYLAYMAATGADPAGEATAAALRPAFGSLDLLVITPITPETEQVLPAAELPGLRSQMNDPPCT